MHWLTTILIFLPVAGAILIAALPLPRYWVGSLASLISLVEVGVWITSATKFDFGSPSLQLDQQTSWVSDLNISYHVGQYAFSVCQIGANCKKPPTTESSASTPTVQRIESGPSWP
jgi:NADH:ubiquinone oxidoreductase subunit 4 (subunit M)